MRTAQNQSGTTLIEISIYFSILAIFLFAAMSFAIQILSISSISGNFNEMQSNIDFIGAEITSNIRNANNINLAASTFDDDLGALSLNMPIAELSPTRFYLSDGNVFVTQGLNPAIQLNSDLVKFSSLNFHRVSANKAPDQIILNAEITPLNMDIASSRKSLDLHLTASLRK